LHLEFEPHRVDGQAELAREVLQRRGREGGREEESRHPEARGLSLLVPPLQHAEAGEQVLDVARQGLERGEGLLLPEAGHGPHRHGTENAVQLRRHDLEPLQGLVEVLEGVADDGGEPVVPEHFLAKDLVH